MTTKTISSPQLDFFAEIERRRLRKQERCRHKFKFIHLYDFERDEAIGKIICPCCGYEEY